MPKSNSVHQNDKCCWNINLDVKCKLCSTKWKPQIHTMEQIGRLKCPSCQHYGSAEQLNTNT